MVDAAARFFMPCPFICHAAYLLHLYLRFRFTLRAAVCHAATLMRSCLRALGRHYARCRHVMRVIVAIMRADILMRLRHRRL